jgi:hypothetical protein
MEEFQERPILKEMHDTNIPFELKQHEESFPSFELPKDLQSLRTLTKMLNFWVEQHRLATQASNTKGETFASGKHTHLYSIASTSSQTPSPKMEASPKKLHLWQA